MKKLAYSLWAVSFVSFVISVIGFVTQSFYMGIPLAAISLVFQILLGYNIFRNKNDRFTMFSVILVALFTFNISGFITIIMRIILKKSKNPDALRRLWFVPACIGVVLQILVSTDILGMILSAAYYLIFGYWFIKELKVNK